MTLLIPAIIIMALVLLNGLFVAAEFAIIGVRPTRLAQLAEQGNPAAHRLSATLQSREQVDRYIATAQLGITLASLGLGMYGEPAIAHLLEQPLHDLLGLQGAAVHTVSFIIGLTVVTYLHVVIGEMAPKSIALQFAERTVLALARPMALIQAIFSIPITVLNQLGLAVLRLIGVPPPSEKSRLHTPGDLEMIISEGVVGGLIDAQEFDLFANIFDLAELSVAQMMTPRIKVQAVPVSTEPAELERMMLDSSHSRLPVYEGDIDHIIGVLHVKSFVTAQLEEQSLSLRQLMDEPVYLPESATAYDLLAALDQRRTQFAVVVGEYGGTAGIVTLEDLLEEVVGEVWDEFDVEQEGPVTLIEPGRLRVRGSARLDELQPYVDLSAYEGKAGSVGGLLLAHVELPPRRGAAVQLGGATLRIEEVDGMTIDRVSVHYDPSEEAPTASTDGKSL